MSAPSPSDRDYVERLGAALRTRDPKALRAFLVEQARGYGGEEQVAQITSQSDAEIETLMHRMTLARSDLSKYHGASRKWLSQRGVDVPPVNRSRRN